MDKIYNVGDFNDIVKSIIDKDYDWNYASVIASDFFLGENEDVRFTDDFSRRYSLVMDYFLHAITEESDRENFKRILNELNDASSLGYITKEQLIYILFKKEIRRLEELYKKRKITPSVLKMQLMKLGNGEFDYDKLLEDYFYS